MTRRSLFQKVLSALAAVPLVGKLGAKASVKMKLDGTGPGGLKYFSNGTPAVDSQLTREHGLLLSRMITEKRDGGIRITGIDLQHRTVYLSADLEGDGYYRVSEPGSHGVIRNLTIPENRDD